ncbi:MBL fold metallo-hydrolase [Roseococcus sp. SYP-B2431]|uniref:MBL fold metallo-hydrolase n=1 Tax=Roseococcus sp. SYP-B2431 TaxID=2496640 RepID=UPI001038ED9F|nr:MBL fold metallo-hydrolase [Roseococcus sp. SYP-B2431]TCH99859.1 MBL fold metallo-hydrolase [Roseococcus sp. SYP-B2431]
MTLRITLLGTGPSQGVPAVGGADGSGNWGQCDPAEPRNRRRRTSALIEAEDGTRLLIDAGPDLRMQLLDNRIAGFDAVLLTHAHADHIAGIDELRGVNRSTGRILPVFASETTLREVRERFGYAFRPATQGFFRPALEGQAVAAGETVRIGPMAVELLDQDHVVMRTLGLRIGGFAYTTDVLRFPPETFERLRGLDTWVVGCMTTGTNPVHANLDEVLDWVAELRPRRTILTHQGDTMDFGKVSVRLPAGVEMGVDGLVLEAPA